MVIIFGKSASTTHQISFHVGTYVERNQDHALCQYYPAKMRRYLIYVALFE